jgi:alpha-ketoglutarate-dependent taurine dioxygenase
MGAQIDGIDLSQPLNDNQFKELNGAFLTHKLLQFKEQSLSPKQQLKFSRRFGPLEEHVLSQFNDPNFPEIFKLSNRKDAEGKPLGAADGGSYWHSDMSYKAEPAKITILHALEIPDVPADTEFVNMQAAYDDLNFDLKELLANTRGVHAYRSNKKTLKGTSFTLSKEQLDQTPAVEHPVFRTHPETGLKSIFAFPGIVQSLSDVSEKEGQKILELLFDHCDQQKFRLNLAWEVGDVAMWDNRCLMHRATTRDLPADAYRTINRTTVSGDRPY